MTENRSEQQENLELDAEPKPLEDPVTWRANDPDYAREPDSESPGGQFSAPDRANEMADREATEVAEGQAPERPAGGAEEQAMQVRDQV